MRDNNNKTSKFKSEKMLTTKEADGCGEPQDRDNGNKDIKVELVDE